VSKQFLSILFKVKLEPNRYIKMEAINKILAQSIAKVNALDTLYEKKTSKKIGNGMDITSVGSCTASVVYHYLRSTNSKVAKLFLDLHPKIDMHPNFTIKDVVDHWKMKKDKKEVQRYSRNVIAVEFKEKKGKIKLQECGSTVVRKKAFICLSKKRPFTPDEDDLIRTRIEEFGDNVKPGKLAKELCRNSGSVIRRIKVLKSGDMGRKYKLFSLLEDKKILEKVLPNLEEKNLKDIVLHESSIQDLAKDLGRSTASVSNRWTYTLQPWIMRHRAGTLNLDIRQMLVNHLSETYSERESIQWDVVAQRPEFAGHTEISLRGIFTNNILCAVQRHGLNMNIIDISLKQIADGFNRFIAEGKPTKVSEKVRERQIKVIEYYERYVNKEITM